MELSPDKGHSKYMYLGQLMVGMDAIQYFKKGIDLMEETLAQEAAQVGWTAVGSFLYWIVKMKKTVWWPVYCGSLTEFS